MREHTTVPLSRLRHIQQTLIGKEKWWLLLLGTTGFIQTMVTIRALLRPFPFALDVDAALFQHGGWYITQGAIPYIDIWDPTPPLSFFLPSLLSLATGGDVLALHVLSMILTGVVAIVIVLLIGRITVDLTGVPWTGLLAGYVMLTFVSFYILPTLGFHFKHYALLFGLLGLLLALNDRPLLGGIVIGASPGFWLTGIIFPMLSLGIAWNRQGGRAMLKVMSGIAITALITLLPILSWGAFELMFQEVIIAPLQASEPQSLVDRFEKGVRFLLFTTPFVIIVPLGVFLRLRRQSSLWWVAAGGAYFSAQLIFLDFDNFPDLLGLLVFIAIGTGIIATDFAPRLRVLIFALVLVALFLNPIIRFVTPDGGNPAAKLTEMREVQGYVLPSMQAIYWNKVKPETCHYRLSETEQTWIARMRELGLEECPARR